MCTARWRRLRALLDLDQEVVQRAVERLGCSRFDKCEACSITATFAPGIPPLHGFGGSDRYGGVLIAGDDKRGHPDSTWHMAGGRTLVVTRKGDGFYVQKVTLDGAPDASTWFPLAKWRPGVTRLEFTTGPEPNKDYGAALADRPPSFRQPWPK